MEITYITLVVSILAATLSGFATALVNEIGRANV
jgi:hypothetical protein